MEFNSFFISENYIPVNFPCNKKHKSSISSTVIGCRIIVAYGSNNLIVILSEGNRISFVLKGHNSNVTCLSFNNTELTLLSCDEEGKCLFWSYKENTWEIQRKCFISTSVTSIHLSYKIKKIFYTKNDGFFVVGIDDTEVHTKLFDEATTCSLSNSARLVGFHNNKRILYIKETSSLNTFVIHIPSNIISFEFHENEDTVLTHSEDGVIRIWTKNIYEFYTNVKSIPSVVSVSFVRNLTRKNVFEVGILDSEENLSIVDMNSSESYLFNNHIHIDSSCVHVTYKLSSKYKTFLFKENEIIYAEQQKNSSDFFRRYFHSSKIIYCEFNNTCKYLYTIDEEKVLIVWEPFSLRSISKYILYDIDLACWISDTIIYVKNNSVYSLSIETYEHKKLNFHLDEVPLALFSVMNDLYFITANSVIFNDKIVKFDFDGRISYKKVNENALVISLLNDELKGMYFPEFVKLDFKYDISSILSVSLLSLNEIAIFTESDIHILILSGNSFLYLKKIPKLRISFLTMMPDLVGGKLLGANKSNFYVFHNEFIDEVDFPGITAIIPNINRDICIVASNTVYLYTMFSGLVIGDPKHTSNKIAVEEYVGPYYVCSHDYVCNRKNLLEISKTTLYYMLDFSAMCNIDKCEATQIPAIPGQVLIPQEALLHGDKVNAFSKDLELLRSFTGDIDMFGYRYLFAISKSERPPAFIGLWLSYSKSQTVIAEYLKRDLNVFDITRFFIHIAICSNILLRDIVKETLSNSFRKNVNIDDLLLFYIALSECNKIIKIYESLGENRKADFFRMDFSVQENRNRAKRNAYSALKKHNYMTSAALFLLVGEINSCIEIISKHIRDNHLSLLILRLYSTTDVVESFFTETNWDDEMVKILWSSVYKKEEMTNMLTEFLHMCHRPTCLGDIRIPLYQILLYINGDKDIVLELAHRLLCCGLAPLAYYIISYAKCRYNRPRCIDIAYETSEYCQNNDDLEESKSIPNVSGEKFDLDFGNASAWDYSCSDDEDIAYTVDEKQNVNSGTAIVSYCQGILDYIIRKAELLSCFLSHVEFSSLNISYVLTEYGSFSSVLNYLKGCDREIFCQRLSEYIDFCIISWISSSKIPSAPKTILALSTFLFEMCTDTEVKLVNLKSILKLRQKKYIRSIYFGFVMTSLWSHNGEFLTQMLSDENPANVSLDDVLQDRDTFVNNCNIYNFINFIPELAKLCTNYNEDLRFITAFFSTLIFKRINYISSLLNEEDSEEWDILFRNFCSELEETMLYFASEDSIQAFSFTKPKQILDLTSVIMNIYSSHTEHYQEIIGNKFPLNRIFFRQDNFNHHTKTLLLESSVRFISFTPGLSQVLLASDLFHLYNVNSDELVEVRDLEMDPKKIVSIHTHPELELFLAFSKTELFLFDLNQSFDIHFGSFESSLNCVEFSPHGNKIAVGLDSVCILYLDIGEKYLKTLVKFETPDKIVILQWLDTETRLVAATHNTIMLINIVDSSYQYIFSDKKNTITFMKYFKELNRLFFGLSNGTVHIYEYRMIFQLVDSLEINQKISKCYFVHDMVIFVSVPSFACAIKTNKDDNSTTPIEIPLLFKDLIFHDTGAYAVTGNQVKIYRF